MPSRVTVPVSAFLAGLVVLHPSLSVARASARAMLPLLGDHALSLDAAAVLLFLACPVLIVRILRCCPAALAGSDERRALSVWEPGLLVLAVLISVPYLAYQVPMSLEGAGASTRELVVGK